MVIEREGPQVPALTVTKGTRSSAVGPWLRDMGARLDASSDGYVSASSVLPRDVPHQEVVAQVVADDRPRTVSDGHVAHHPRPPRSARVRVDVPEAFTRRIPLVTEAAACGGLIATNCPL